VSHLLAVVVVGGGRVVVVVGRGNVEEGDVVEVVEVVVVGGGGNTHAGMSSGKLCVTGEPSAAVPDTPTARGFDPAWTQVSPHEARPDPDVVVGLGVSTVQPPEPLRTTVALMGAVRTTPLSLTVRVPSDTTRLAGLSTNGGLGAIDTATVGPL